MAMRRTGDGPDGAGRPIFIGKWQEFRRFLAETVSTPATTVAKRGETGRLWQGQTARAAPGLTLFCLFSLFVRLNRQ